MNKKSIKDIDIKGKRVFIRVDFNVPVKNGEIEDDTRIKGALADDQIRRRTRRESHSRIASRQTDQRQTKSRRKRNAV